MVTCLYPLSAVSRACSTILVSASSWSDASSLISCRDVSDDHTFTVSLKAPLITRSRPGGALWLSKISVEWKWAKLASLSCRMMKFSQFPIPWSLLSTLRLIPLLFFTLRLSLVPPFIEFLTYLSDSTSTLVQLSEKWEVTWRRNRSLHSQKVFAPEELARGWTVAIPSIRVHVWLLLMGIWFLQTFPCKMVPRSDFPASRRLPSRVDNDF